MIVLGSINENAYAIPSLPLIVEIRLNEYAIGRAVLGFVRQPMPILVQVLQEIAF